MSFLNHLRDCFMKVGCPITHPHIDRKINAAFSESGSKRVRLLKCQLVKGRKTAKFDIVAHNLFHTRSIRWCIPNDSLDKAVRFPRTGVILPTATGGRSSESNKQDAVVRTLRIDVLIQRFSPLILRFFCDFHKMFHIFKRRIPMESVTEVKNMSDLSTRL